MIVDGDAVVTERIFSGHTDFVLSAIFVAKERQESERAKGAAKGSCGETVVQKVFLGESVSSLPPYGFLLKHLKGPENLKGDREETDFPKTPFWTTVSPHDPFAAPLARLQRSAIAIIHRVLQGAPPRGQ